MHPVTDAQKPDARHEQQKTAEASATEAGQAIADSRMIEAGDKNYVLASAAGRISYAMLDILLSLQKKAPGAL